MNNNTKALIARFMGMTSSFDTFFDKEQNCHFEIKDLKYDTSWDWLMQVWIKFRDLKYRELDGQHLRLCERIRPFITDGTIHQAFEEIVKGIKWYNSKYFPFEII